jgi:hypothetical protein
MGGAPSPPMRPIGPPATTLAAACLTTQTGARGPLATEGTWVCARAFLFRLAGITPPPADASDFIVFGSDPCGHCRFDTLDLKEAKALQEELA